MTQIGRQEEWDKDKVAVHPDPEGPGVVRDGALRTAIEQASTDNASGAGKAEIAPPAEGSGSSLPIPK